MRLPRHPLACFFLLGAMALFAARLAATEAPAPAAETSAAIEARAEALIGRADLADYRGWLKYLLFLSRRPAASLPAGTEEPHARLASWLAKIENDPQLLSKLRGVQEWAYEAPADGTGQPFKIALPSDYEPEKAVPLTVYTHGYSGNHLEHSVGMASLPGVFQVAVLGRARGGWYRGLSEDDVLRVIDYIQAHWNIDADRIHISGGSMGGGATFRLGSRYPHRWASGKITCGFGTLVPMGNLVTLPLYATHSQDDYTVAVSVMRAPFARLRALGGHAIADETDGLGHAAWDYAEGNRRAGLWEMEQVRPASHNIRRIDYTATDGGAVRGWWGQLAEWGGEPRPAHFLLSAGANNDVYAELSNVQRLTLRLDEAPVERSRPLQVSVNGGLPLSWQAPLPERLEVVCADGVWRLQLPASAPETRLHTPGGALLLYQGEPLLIVYGTLGSPTENAAMKAAAEAAAASPNPSWAAEKGDPGPDGVPHHRLLYGHLPTKSDKDLTPEDLASKHLVLIGTAAQNAVVARLAAKLPVQFDKGEIRCNDGQSFPADKAQLSFVYFNPLAPGRLIHWVASNDAAYYKPDAVAPRMADAVGLGSDLLVADAEKECLVAARSFDSAWKWNDRRAASAPIPGGGTNQDLAAILAEALRLNAGVPLALGGFAKKTQAPAWTPGQTRFSDLLTLCYFRQVVLFEQEASTLIENERRLSQNPDSAPSTTSGKSTVLFPSPSKTLPADSKTAVRVAADADAFWTYCVATHSAPKSCILSNETLSDALNTYLALKASPGRE